MAAPSTVSTPGTTFSDQAAQARRVLQERKIAEPAYKSFMGKKAEIINGIYESTRNVFRKIQSDPSTLEYAVQFFNGSYAIMIVVPPVDKDPDESIFAIDPAVFIERKPFSDKEFTSFIDVLCKRVQHMIEKFFSENKEEVIRAFLDQVGPSGHLQHEFTGIPEEKATPQCYIAMKFSPKA